VWGEDDQLIPPALAPAWAKLLPNARIATFPDAGHLVLDESPEASAAVARFCAGAADG
jgi:pimeloyl-ACP methyl ester carboxylesterase